MRGSNPEPVEERGNTVQAQDMIDVLAAPRASVFASAVITGTQKATDADHAVQDSFFVPTRQCAV